MTVFRCAAAWVEGGVVADVDIATGPDGYITAIVPSDLAVLDVVELPGVVLPGFANAHSHAFHRALRGRTHGDGGTFWTWRDRMYRVARTLDPDSYYALARATFGEMVLAGVTSVGEFHYVHHSPDGTAYADPNAMGEAVRVAARDAGLRLTLLDTCYLAGGLTPDGHTALGPDQVRFGDGDVAGWAARFHLLADDDNTRIGAAIHSVRAVPRDAIPAVVAAVGDRPLHVHLSEQVAENSACLGHYGVTPTRLLEDCGALGPQTTAVHATHLTDDDIAALGRTATFSCFCPTTERDLADGIGPALELLGAGSPLCLGSDQHAVIDLIEEARALEMHERLVSHERGRKQPPELMTALTDNGHRSLGWSDVGTIAVGRRADLVAVRLDTVRTVGSLPDQILLTAFAPDVDTVVVDGRVVVSGGRHASVDVAQELHSSIRAVWDHPEATR
jgi:formiminoglutamate deiminase